KMASGFEILDITSALEKGAYVEGHLFGNHFDSVILSAGFNDEVLIDLAGLNMVQIEGYRRSSEIHIVNSESSEGIGTLVLGNPNPYHDWFEYHVERVDNVTKELLRDDLDEYTRSWLESDFSRDIGDF